MPPKATKPIRDRSSRLKREYGMTDADYNRMLAAQQGKCGICRQYRRLSVDHCHDTKKVRGLLCSHCNTAIGLLNENEATLQSAIVYLQKHTTK